MAAKTTFSTATAADRERGEQAVLDLVAVGELDDQGQRRALQAGEHGGQRHQPREEHQLVAGPGVAELGEDLAEHEEQEEGLQDDLGQEDGELPAGDEQVTAQDGEARSATAPIGEASRSADRAGRSTSATVIGAPSRSGG